MKKADIFYYNILCSINTLFNTKIIEKKWYFEVPARGLKTKSAERLNATAIK